MFSEEHHIPKKKHSYKEAKLKAADYCAFQERSQQEVRDKLYSYGLHQDQVEELLSELITENFINEERFAIAYAGGKFRMKSWGRIKIMQGLKQHRVSEYCIKNAFKEIDEDEYLRTIDKLIATKKLYASTKTDFTQNQKIARYLMQKGFEPALVWDQLKKAK